MHEHPWFQHQIRVRYEETDQMGVVYHANYLTWFEIGRTELIRDLGYPYRLIEEKGLLLPLVEAEMKFKQPARYDDLIDIYTRVVSYSHIRLEFASEIRRVNEDLVKRQSIQPEHRSEPEGELLVSGGTKHVWVNPSWKPIRIDREAPDLYALITKRS
ncbi:Acyl-CoA thioester hydrolase YbgC [compost metagenome]